MSNLQGIGFFQRYLVIPSFPCPEESTLVFKIRPNLREFRVIGNYHLLADFAAVKKFFDQYSDIILPYKTQEELDAFLFDQAILPDSLKERVNLLTQATSKLVKENLAWLTLKLKILLQLFDRLNIAEEIPNLLGKIPNLLYEDEPLATSPHEIPVWRADARESDLPIIYDRGIASGFQEDTSSTVCQIFGLPTFTDKVRETTKSQKPLLEKVRSFVTNIRKKKLVKVGLMAVILTVSVNHFRSGIQEVYKSYQQGELATEVRVLTLEKKVNDMEKKLDGMRKDQ